MSSEPREPDVPSRNDIMLALFEHEQSAMEMGNEPSGIRIEALRLQRRHTMARVDALVAFFLEASALGVRVETGASGWPEPVHRSFLDPRDHTDGR